MRARRKGADSEQVCAGVRTASGPFCSLSQLWTIFEQVFSMPTLSGGEKWYFSILIHLF